MHLQGPAVRRHGQHSKYLWYIFHACIHGLAPFHTRFQGKHPCLGWRLEFFDFTSLFGIGPVQFSGLSRVAEASQKKKKRFGGILGFSPKKLTRFSGARAHETKFTKLMGHGLTTVSRLLFQNGDLTEFCSKLNEFSKNFGEFALTHTHTHTHNGLR